MRLSTSRQYRGASAVRIRFPQMIIGTYRRPMASDMPPLMMYILLRPMLDIHGTRAEGTPTLTALRTKATATKTSAVSFCGHVSIPVIFPQLR